MPYNENLDAAIQSVIAEMNFMRKKMFGGTGYLLNGNMVCGVYKDFLILRLDESVATEAVKSNQAKVFDITGRPMKGWVMIAYGTLDPVSIKKWINKSRDFVTTLPPK